MPKRFFKLTDDVYLSGRWELGHPPDQEGCKLDDPWKFKIGQRALPDERIRILIKRLLVENPTVTGDGRYAHPFQGVGGGSLAVGVAGEIEVAEGDGV